MAKLKTCECWRAPPSCSSTAVFPSSPSWPRPRCLKVQRRNCHCLLHHLPGHRAFEILSSQPTSARIGTIWKCGVIFISTLVEVGVPEISWSNSSSSSSSLTPSPPPPIGVVLSPLPEKHSVVTLQVDDVQLQTYKSTFWNIAQLTSMLHCDVNDCAWQNHTFAIFFNLFDGVGDGLALFGLHEGALVLRVVLHVHLTRQTDGYNADLVMNTNAIRWFLFWWNFEFQLLHGFKLFHLVSDFQNRFCFWCTTFPSAVRKIFRLQWEFQWENDQNQ